MKNLWYYKYPIGVIGIAEADGHIVSVFFADEDGRLCENPDQCHSKHSNDESGFFTQPDGSDNAVVNSLVPSVPPVSSVPQILVKSTVKKHALIDFELRESALIQETAKQLREYFEGTRRGFDLPLAFNGTDFQQKIWAALLAIPYGETRTYGEIAAQAGNPKAARAAGMANNRNPIVIICPCHRVIGKDGSLVGFGGGLPVKKYLLDLESLKKV